MDKITKIDYSKLDGKGSSAMHQLSFHYLLPDVLFRVYKAKYKNLNKKSESNQISKRNKKNSRESNEDEEQEDGGMKENEGSLNDGLEKMTYDSSIISHLKLVDKAYNEYQEK